MDKNNIENLVEKYFDGNTSLEEERQLKKIFQQDQSLPEELQVYQSFFVGLDEAHDIMAPSNLEQNVLEKINKPSGKVRRLFPMLLKMASVFVIGVSIYFLTQQYQSEGNREVAMMEDTYDTPEEAFAAYKAAIALTSRKIKKGERKVKNEISYVKVLTRVIKSN